MWECSLPESWEDDRGEACCIGSHSFIDPLLLRSGKGSSIMREDSEGGCSGIYPVGSILIALIQVHDCKGEHQCEERADESDDRSHSLLGRSTFPARQKLSDAPGASECKAHWNKEKEDEKHPLRKSVEECAGHAGTSRGMGKGMRLFALMRCTAHITMAAGGGVREARFPLVP